jgi:hypothetical protein
MTLAMGLCSAITIVSAVVSLGYSVVGLRGATPGSRLASEYALARSIAPGVIAVIAPCARMQHSAPRRWSSVSCLLHE